MPAVSPASTPSRSPAPDSAVVDYDNGPADVPFIASKAWNSISRFGTWLAIIACVIAIGGAGWNWKRAGKHLDNIANGLQVPQGAGLAYFIGQDQNNHYLEVPEEDRTVIVPNYFYEYANCHSGGYNCSPAELEHAFWSRLYSGTLPSTKEVQQTLRKWRRNLAHVAQQTGASADEALDIADDAIRASYNRAVAFESNMEDWMQDTKATMFDAKDTAQSELSAAKQRLAYRVGMYSALPWYKRIGASTLGWVAEHVPGAAFLAPEPRASWIKTRRASKQAAEDMQDKANSALGAVESAWDSAKDQLPGMDDVKHWINVAHQDLAEILPSRRTVKHKSNAAINKVDEQLRSLQSGIMELRNEYIPAHA